MNSSKKLRTKKVKKDRLIEKKPFTKISKPWIIASAVLIIILIGAILFDQLYERTVMTIDGEKYKMSDLSYYFYQVESEYAYYDQMFGGGGAYWDMTYDETTGATIRDMAKQGAVESCLYNEILYKEAIAADYTLTDDEKKTVSANADSLLKDTLSSTEISKNKFTKKNLTEVIGKITLVARYRQDKIDSFDIDDQAIKDGIIYDNYRQYDIETLYIPTTTTDADGKSVALTAEEKSAAHDKLNSYYQAAKDTEDWSALLPKDETSVTYQSTNFVETDTTYSDDMEAMMIAMNNGDISDIYEAEDGYYVVRMVNNNSSESYDKAVADAINSAESSKFSSFYDELAAKHEYTTNDSLLASLTMGNITID